MAEPLVVVLLVVAGTRGEGPRDVLVGTAVREALGSEARVLVEERERAPADAEARELASRVGANAVAELRWADDTRSRAQLHVFVAADDTFYDRELSFSTADVDADRQRAVGLLVGAMVRAAARSDDAAPRTPAPAAREPPPAPGPAPPPSPRIEPERPRAEPTTWSRRPFALEAGATAAAAVGGEGSGLGPAVGAYVHLASRIAVRASGAMRFGPVAGADASLTTVRVGAGPAFLFIGDKESDPFGLLLSMEGLALNHAVRREAPSAREERWIGGALASLSASWRASTFVEPFLSVGVEVAFGTTPIVIDGATTATIPLARLTGDGGVRVRF